MTTKDSTRFDRRSVLKLTGTVGIGGLAGCLGGGGGGDGGDGGDGGEPTASPTPSFPTEPMTWVVPYGTGGGYDFYTRLVAKYLNEKDYLPVQQRVENVTGAGGIVAANQVYNEEPDGYTNMILNTETFAVSQLARDVDYEVDKFTYYARVAGTTRTIAVATRTDVTSGEELISETQAGNLTYGTQGRTGDTALMVIFLGEIAGLWSAEDYRSFSVSFEERGQEVTAIKNGDIDVMTGSFSSLLPFVESGDLRPVLVYTQEDSCPPGTNNDDCDTFATIDTEVQNAEQVIALSGGPFHRVFGGPPEVPENRANVIREALDQAINDPDLRAEAEEAGRPITYGDAETTRNGVVSTINAYQENQDLLREAGLLE